MAYPPRIAQLAFDLLLSGSKIESRAKHFMSFPMVWERAKLAALFSIVAASAGRVDILSEKDRKYLVASIFLYRCTDPSSNLKLLLSRMEAVGFLLALRRASPDLVEAVARGENCPWLFDLVSHFRQHAITESLVERLPYSEYFPVSTYTAPRRRNSDPSIMLGRLLFAAPDPSWVPQYPANPVPSLTELLAHFDLDDMDPDDYVFDVFDDGYVDDL
jgi:hypothetical protein